MINRHLTASRESSRDSRREKIHDRQLGNQATPRHDTTRGRITLPTIAYLPPHEFCCSPF